MSTQPLPPDNAATVQHPPDSAEVLFERCRDLAESPAILDHFLVDLERAGLVGEERVAKLLFLVLITRVFDKPVSAILKASSSAGKSYTVDQVLRFFPESAYQRITAMSERVIAYDTEPISHRFLVIAEESGLRGDMATYLIRSLMSEGQLNYKVVEHDKSGKYVVRSISREGPTGLLLTTTRFKIHPENETRMLSIPVNESRSQTIRVLRRTASQSDEVVDYSRWHHLQTWIELGELRVFIPYATVLVDLIDTVALRIRRDFTMVLYLIRAHALLHRETRDKNSKGAIVATLDDYSAVRTLIYDLVSEGQEQAVSATVREVVAAVRFLTGNSSLNPNSADKVNIPGTPSASDVARHLGVDRSTALRHVKKAINLGFLINSEARRGQPMRLEVGDPLPDDRQVLPTTEALTHAIKCCSVAPVLGGNGEVPSAEPAPRETIEI